MVGEPPVILVMGVSGCGKTTLGRLLARRLDAAFVDGDDLHGPENRAKMEAGVPLDDLDRRPWLAAIAKTIEGWRKEKRSGVIACSALKRAYRDELRSKARNLRLIFLRGSRAVIARRLAVRHGHFMPTSLLQSQFEALEEPALEECALILDVEASPDALVDQAARWLGVGQPDGK
ncbi:MAG TPA: gluconokinase [Beijerinckiaceae bacterium]|nr:gluconokinase [Beijerinckiaceae bacterium]